MSAVAQEAVGYAGSFTQESGDRNREETKVQECAAFDVLRFLLASVVLLSHIGVLEWRHAGNLAVQVFFALSGWLIGSILCRTRPGELNRFYFNRASRIWIPYLATVAGIYLVSFLHESHLSSRWHEFLIYDLTFTHNWFSLLPTPHIALGQMPLRGTNNGLWSIGVEEQFYLIAPLILTLVPFGRRIGLWVFIAAAAILEGGWYGSVSLGVMCAVIAYRYPGWQTKRPPKSS